MALTKTCTKCEEEKLATNEYFARKKNGKYGLNGYCKECQKKINKQYYKENKEKILINDKKYKEANKERYLKYQAEWRKENQARIKKTSKDYYKENRETILQKNKEYDKKNKAERLEYLRQWRKNNRELQRGYKNRRRYFIKELPATLTLNDWEVTKKDFDFKCAYCGLSEEEHLKKHNISLHQEHFIPVNDGGEYTHNNIIPACQSCNSSKRDTSFFEWYPKQEFYCKKREKRILEYLGYIDGGIQQLSIL